MDIDVILVEPSVPGNIGAVARVMKNFGFKNLVLVDPECDQNNLEAKNRAKHAQDVLKNAKKKKWEKLEYDYLVGTTGRLGGDYNLPRSPVSPSEFALLAKKLEGKIKLGLVFGRESDGLRNDEIGKCDFVLSIPTVPKYTAMNLSHAVAVVLYELHKVFGKERIGEAIKPVGKKEKEKLIDLIDQTVDKVNFKVEHKRKTQKVLWRRIVGKAMLTNREAMAMMGFFRRVKKE